MSDDESNCGDSVSAVGRNADFLLLKQKCASFFVDLQDYHNLANPNDGTLRIQADLKEIEKIKAEFSDSSISVIVLAKTFAPDTVGQFEGERVSFMKAYKEICNKLIAELPQSQSLTNETRMMVSPFKLPKIDLLKFDSDFAKWSEFKGIFESLIVDHQDLDVMSKYQFL